MKSWEAPESNIMKIGCPFKKKCAHKDLLTLRDILDSCVVHMASSCSKDLCWTMRGLVALTLRMRSRILPWCCTVSNDVTNLTTIVASVGDYDHFL
jgi:hypothetical protein